MPQPHTEWTLEMVHALPDDGNRYELLDGELLVSPAPSLRHQRVMGRLFATISAYVEAIGGCEAFFAPVAITFAPRRELQPDIVVLPYRADGRRAARFEDVGRLLLAVEGLSPSTERTDRGKKRPAYQDEGVPECWLVDLEAAAIERWRPRDERPEVARRLMTWQPDPSRARLEIDLERLFRDG